MIPTNGEIKAIQTLVLASQLIAPIGGFSTKNLMPYFWSPTWNPPSRFGKFGGGILTRGSGRPPHGNGGLPRLGSGPSGRGDEPSSKGGPPSGGGQPSGGGPQEGVEEDFRLKAQVCFLMPPSHDPLRTHGTHHGVHH